MNKPKYQFNLINAAGLVIDTKLSTSIQSAAKSFKKVWETYRCRVVYDNCNDAASYTATSYNYR